MASGVARRILAFPLCLLPEASRPGGLRGAPRGIIYTPIGRFIGQRIRNCLYSREEGEFETQVQRAMGLVEVEPGRLPR